MMVLMYAVLINFVAYTVMKADKKKARQNKRRTSERTLWLLALIGGAPGSWVAMQTHRHKTKHASFTYGMPVLAVIDFIVLAWAEGRDFW